VEGFRSYIVSWNHWQLIKFIDVSKVFDEGHPLQQSPSP
jgi:hypothetical protein